MLDFVQRNKTLRAGRMAYSWHLCQQSLACGLIWPNPCPSWHLCQLPWPRRSPRLSLGGEPTPRLTTVLSGGSYIQTSLVIRILYILVPSLEGDGEQRLGHFQFFGAPCYRNLSDGPTVSWFIAQVHQWARMSPEIHAILATDLLLYEFAVILFKKQTADSLGIEWE